jgi:WD40 repeat protein
MSELPSSPYKGLAAFGDSALDALLFFGREREREAIVSNLLATKLTVLYGPSGVGKSSLVRAGVAQRLRAIGNATVVVHDSWVEDPAGAVVASLREACPELGPTAGLVDTVAAAAQQSGEVYLLFDQFEEYFLYHGSDGPLADSLPELLRRPGLRLNMLISLRGDAVAELDAFAARLPGVFGNMLRLDRLDRRSARSAITGPLQRYSELAGATYTAETALIETLLDEVAPGRVDFSGAGEVMLTDGGVEAPYLQLVLERLWSEETADGSHELRLASFRRLGGAEQIVRDHVHGTLGALPAAAEDAAARMVRQLVTPSGAKISYTAADLVEYTGVRAAELAPLLETLVRERIVRGVDGSTNGSTRYEIFHDVLAEPLLDWRAEYELERARIAARRQRRRLLALVAAALGALVVVSAIAAFALTQRSTARSEARRAHARELDAQALGGLSTDPAASLGSALTAAELVPGTQTEDVLRSSLLAMRERHVLRLGGSIVGASFPPVGEHLLVASSNGTAGLYDANGKRLVKLAHGHKLTRTAWTPDGRRFAIGEADGSVRVWDAPDGHFVREVITTAPVSVLSFTRNDLLVGSGGWIRIRPNGPGGLHRNIRAGGAVVAAALSPNGRLLAVASMRKGQIATRILDVDTGKARALLPERGIGSLGFSADGRLLVTGSTDKTARLWRAVTGRLVHILPQSGHVLAERFSPDGKSLVTSSADGSAAVWDVRTGARVFLLVGSTGIANAAAFSPDGKEITVAFGDRVARIYSTQDGRLLAPLAGHEDAVTSVGYDPLGRVIVTGGDDGTARLWSADAGDKLTPIDRRQGAVETLWAGDRVVSAAGRDVRVLDLGGRVLRQTRMAARVTAVAAHDTSLAIADATGDLDLPTGVSHLGVTAVAYAADGSLVTASRDGTIRVWSDTHVIHKIEAAGEITGISAGARRFAALMVDGTVRVYALDGQLLATLPAHAGGATISRDGAIVATTAGRDAVLWDAASGKLLHRLSGHRSLVTDAELSPDGSLLVTASVDHDARIWDVASGRLLHVLRGHFLPVKSASFSPDGRWIVTASYFSAGLWNADTGDLLLYLTGNTKPLTGATFSPAGDWILAGSEDGTARVVRCDICRDLRGLEQVARERLQNIG